MSIKTKAIVIDSNIALSWLVEEEDNEYASGILKDIGYGMDIYINDLFFVEVLNGLLILEREQCTDEKDSKMFFNFVKGLGFKLIKGYDSDLVLSLGRRYSLSAPSSMYLAAAIAHNIPLATQDLDLKVGAIKEGMYYDTSRDPTTKYRI